MFPRSAFRETAILIFKPYASIYRMSDGSEGFLLRILSAWIQSDIARLARYLNHVTFRVVTRRPSKPDGTRITRNDQEREPSNARRKRETPLFADFARRWPCCWRVGSACCWTIANYGGNVAQLGCSYVKQVACLPAGRSPAADMDGEK